MLKQMLLNTVLSVLSIPVRIFHQVDARAPGIPSTYNDANDVVADRERDFKRLWGRLIPRDSAQPRGGKKMGLILLHRSLSY